MHYNTIIYHTRKELGRCPKCGKKLEEGSEHVFCAACRERERKRANEQRAAETPKQHFLRNENNRTNQQNRRERLRAEGLCIYCGKPQKPGYSLCETCSEKNKARSRARREKEKAKKEAIQ